jgi:hypothetical protein
MFARLDAPKLRVATEINLRPEETEKPRAAMEKKLKVMMSGAHKTYIATVELWEKARRRTWSSSHPKPKSDRVALLGSLHSLRCR